MKTFTWKDFFGRKMTERRVANSVEMIEKIVGDIKKRGTVKDEDGSKFTPDVTVARAKPSNFVTKKINHI